MNTLAQIVRSMTGHCLAWQRRRQPASLRAPGPLDASVLEDRTLYSVTPLVLDALEVQLAEDAPDASLDLTRYFSVDDRQSQVDYTLIDQAGDAMFDRTPLTGDGRLLIDLAENEFGNAEFMIQAINRAGGAERLPVHVQVLPVNDTPTTTGVVNIREPGGTDRAVIDLFAAFDDVEDGARGLTYSVAVNSNPALFDSVTINQGRGRLVLDYADNASGASTLNVIATDSGGLSVGMANDNDFAVYNEIHGRNGTSPDTSDLGLKPHDLWTGGRFFVGTRGNYDFDQVDFDRYDRFLARGDASIPNTFNLEDRLFDNSAAGRDRFAELLHYAKTERPDLDIGVYRILPERQFHDPVRWQRAQDDAALGLSTWFTDRTAEFEAGYEAWQARNTLFRTQNVSGQFGGQTVADLVDIVNPSLYTLRRNEEGGQPLWREADLDFAADTISVDGPSFEFVDTVRLRLGIGATLNNGLSKAETYHVVNADDSTFQVSLTPGGAPIDFDQKFSGRIFAGATDLDYAWHDPDVVYWKTYAEENIAEARKYGKRVHAWLKPTMHKDSTTSLDYDFFRWQLETVRPLVDGVVIYEDPILLGSDQVQQEWWAALEDFMATLNGPDGSFRVNVLAPSQDPADPVASATPVDDTLTASEDAPATWDVGRLLANDAGVTSSDSIRVSQPTHGSLEQLADGSLKYTPDRDFNGIDQFRYRITDGRSESTSASVDIRVAAENDAPVTRNDTVQATEDEVLSIDSGDLLANDRDADGDELNFRIVAGPAHGHLVQDDDGTIRYRPNDNFAGSDHFQYRVNDGQSGSNVATVRIDVAAVNDLPNASPDILRTDEDTPLALGEAVLLQNDVDADMDRLKIVVVDEPSHGNIGRGADGKLVYRPDRNFHGTDQFGYLVTDGQGRSDVVAVIVRVLPTNDDPITTDDRYTTRAGQILRVDGIGGVLANDRDVEGDNLRARLLSGPSNGQVTLAADGSFVYSPEQGFSGVDRFEYVALDGNGGQRASEVVLKVTPTPSTPVTEPDPQPPNRNPGNNPGGRQESSLLPVGIPLFRLRR